MGTINLLNAGVIKFIMSRALYIAETIKEYQHETSISSDDNTTKNQYFHLQWVAINCLGKNRTDTSRKAI